MFGQKPYVKPGAMNFWNEIEKAKQRQAEEQPLSFDMLDESCLKLDESEFYGNRTYWHGSWTLKAEGENPSVIDKLKHKGVHKEIYFSTHFGYSLAYSLRLNDFHTFKSLATGTELVNAGKQMIEISPETQKIVQNILTKFSAWIILFKMQAGTRLFHANDPGDMRALYMIMQSSKNPNFEKFLGVKGSGKYMSLEEFYEKTKPLQTIDWLAGIPASFPFNREELLSLIRSYKPNGRVIWQGYVNCEKENYNSIGLFEEHLKQLLVGPLYQVKLEENQLAISRYGHSVNASLPPTQSPNAP
jgi:hypothetical protein